MKIILLLLLALPLSAVEIARFDTHDFSFSATVPGNQFDVAITGNFVGPTGERISIPGFYDGDNTWKIRFAPTAVGKWSMRTTSAVPALNGKADGEIVCRANPHPHIAKGALRVDAAHPYHFVFEDGSRYFL